MKSNSIALLLLVAVTAAFAANVSNFSEVDTDKDGALSIAEAKMALPGVEIEDANRDGMVNRNEAAASIKGYILASSDPTEASAPVQEADYRLIVQALEKVTPTRNVSTRN